MPLSETLRLNTLMAAQLVSELGSSVSAIAVPLFAVEDLHVTALTLGALSAAGALPWLLFGLHAGSRVESWRKRRVLVAADVVRALIMGIVPITAILGKLTLGLLFAVAASASTMTVLFEISYQAFIPLVASEAGLVAANARFFGSQAIAGVAGPGVAGALYQFFGGVKVVALDAISFLVSAACLVAVRVHEERLGRPADRDLTRVLRGLSFVWQTLPLRLFGAYACYFTLLLAAAQPVLLLAFVRTFHLPAFSIGLVLSASAVGALTATVVTGSLVQRLGEIRAIRVAAAAGGTSGALLAVAYLVGNIPLVGVALLGLSFSFVVFGIVAATIRQQITPSSMLARAVASTRVFTWGAAPLGGLVGGGMASVIGGRGALVVIGAAFSVSPLWLRDRRLDTIGQDARRANSVDS